MFFFYLIFIQVVSLSLRSFFFFKRETFQEKNKRVGKEWASLECQFAEI